MSEYISRESVDDVLADLSQRTQTYPFGAIAIAMAIDKINSISTADVAPVVHAHYKTQYLKESKRYDLECSKCGFRIVLDYNDIQYARYCNSCGAIMDESEE